VTLSLGTAYRSFGGEVEASSTPTICRLPDSRRHQLSAIAHAVRKRAHLLKIKLARSPPGLKVKRRPHPCTVLISDTVEQELGHPETHNAAKPNSAWWRCVRSGQCNPPVATVSTMRASHRARVRAQTGATPALVSTALPASHPDGCSSAQITNSG